MANTKIRLERRDGKGKVVELREVATEAEAVKYVYDGWVRSVDEPEKPAAAKPKPQS